MRVFYFLSSCDSCKRIQAELKLDSSITLIDIKKSPLTLPQLEQLHSLAGSYEALFSKRAQLYKQRNLKEQNLSEG
ncbi:MAG: arsenate reductase family protein, partial [Flavobacteriaceae bacterium]